MRIGLGLGLGHLNKPADPPAASTWRFARVYDNTDGALPSSNEVAAIGRLLMEIALDGSEFLDAIGGYRPLGTTLTGTVIALGEPGYIRFSNGDDTIRDDIPLVLPDDSTIPTQEVSIVDAADENTALGAGVVHHMGQWFPGMTVTFVPPDLQLLVP